MLMIAAASLLTGVAFGLRFQMFVLLPALALAFLLVTALGLVRGNDFSVIAVGLFVAAGAMQIGYLAGILARQVLFQGVESYAELAPGKLRKSAR